MQDFQEQINLAINKGKSSNLPLTNAGSMGGNLAALATALSTDTTTHADAVEAPPAALKTNLIPNDRMTQFVEQVNLVINMGKANNLPNSGATSMATILNNAVTALTGDATAHSREMEQPPAALLPDLGN